MAHCSNSCVFNRQFVPLRGRPDSPYLIVGEAPGAKELQLGQPFVGPAGQLLSRYLVSAGIPEELCAFTNTTCCVDLTRTPAKPTPEDILACRPRLQEEINTSSAKLVIALGATASAELLPGMRITGARGKFRRVRDKVVISSYHPSAVLRGNSQYGELLLKDLITARRYVSGAILG